jgi:hypothetical protein
LLTWPFVVAGLAMADGIGAAVDIGISPIVKSEEHLLTLIGNLVNKAGKLYCEVTIGYNPKWTWPRWASNLTVSAKPCRGRTTRLTATAITTEHNVPATRRAEAGRPLAEGA